MKTRAISLVFLGVFLGLTLSSFDLSNETESINSSPHSVEIPKDSTGFDMSYCQIENTAFQIGEELTYKLYYRLKFIWLPAAEVVFKVEETPEGQLHLSATGHTYKTYNMFVKVRDRFESYVDKQTMLPDVSIKNIKEGKYELYDKVEFSQKENKVVEYRGRSVETAISSTHEIDGCIHDVLSVIYYSRNINFEGIAPGVEFPVQVFVDKKAYPLSMIYNGKVSNKRIKGKGRFDTIHLSPGTIAGDVFKEGTKMDIWVSDDQNKVPLLIKVPVSVGSIRAVLKKHKGLRYNLTSQLK